jgi:ABC-type transport system involved in cytochrome bd biosynthesis fused ATPase/permease subunit
MTTLRVAFLSSAVLEFVATISVALVAVSVGLRLDGGSLSLRTALVVLLLAPEAYWPFRQVGLHFHAASDGLAAAEAIFTVLEEEPDAGGPAKAITRAPDLTRSVIRLDGISVRFDRALPALAPMDLEIHPGEHLGIAGPTGCGKSTLLSVLLGFVTPTSGRVLIEAPNGEVDLAAVEGDAWRSRIAWVPQRPWLASRSIADNVRLARPDADDATVIEALRSAEAYDFVSRLPDGMFTVLGQNGHGLSAGQRQRIALARAFLRNADLVLLDEASAHLDPATESRVAAAVRRLAADHTVISVAHRPALLSDVDRLIVLGERVPV